MAKKNVDIIIHGAGIAGLWTFNCLKTLGYDVLLIEKNSIGGGQSIASQGIIHSGLKYSLAGKVNKLAKNISAMPDRWRAALSGTGEVDLSNARIAANSQQLMIPSGFMGSMVKIVTTKALGDSVADIPKDKWPSEIQKSGFKGNLIHMGEPVLDIPSVVKALATPYRDCICKPNESLSSVKAKKYIYTAASSNQIVASQNSHDHGLDTQKRPLLMGFLKPAPFELYAHLVGTSDKPIATITTHICEDGDLCWYLGGQVAERRKEASPNEVYDMARKAFKKYLPDINFENVQWGTLPIDRVEGKSNTDNWLPDTPTLHHADNHLYCWPTKLTFAPMLCDKIIEHLESHNIEPSNMQTDFSDFEKALFSKAPWDEVEWKNGLT